jgi:hypothetical protein
VGRRWVRRGGSGAPAGLGVVVNPGSGKEEPSWGCSWGGPTWPTQEKKDLAQGHFPG